MKLIKVKCADGLLLLPEKKYTPVSLNFLLKNTEKERFRIRTSYVLMGWHDVETIARRHGFSVSKVEDQDLSKNKEFAQCYDFERDK